jgi:hypothetical protein
MNNKSKILLILLGIVSLLGISLAVWIYLSARQEIIIYSEKQGELEEKNTRLQEEMDSIHQESRGWQEKAESITRTLNKSNREYGLLQNQYVSLMEEKDFLAQKNKTLAAEAERLDKLYAQAQKKTKPGSSDKFLSALLEEKAALEVKVEELKQFAGLEQDKTALETKLQDIDKVTDKLSKDLLLERKKRVALEVDLARNESKLKKMMLERDKLAQQLSEMKEGLDQGQRKLDRAQTTASIQLPPIIVRADYVGRPADAGEEAEEDTSVIPAKAGIQTGQPRRSLEGKIITISGKHKFAVINLGRDNGVETGMEFDVYRGEENIGVIEVIEMRNNISACDVKEISVKKLKVGDVVYSDTSR